MDKMKLGRRGESAFEIAHKQIFFVIFLFVLVIIFIIFGMLINSFIEKNSKLPKGLIESSLMNRFYNTAGCFAYVDPSTGKTIPNSIDRAKFNGQQMASCYSPGKSDYAFQLTLRDRENKEELGEVHTDNWFNYPYRRITVPVVVGKDKRLELLDIDIEKP